MPATDNLLFYGDNLDVLRRHIEDESVDLVYLDPPFKSDQNYNVLFAAKDGTQAAAQIQAFEDTWSWDEAAARTFAETVEQGGAVADVLLAFERFIPASDMLAYLAMMAPRLMELRRVLKETGSLYLHCDPTASHYLKLLLDAVFGPTDFRNEVIWKRTHAHGSAKRWGDVHDTLLYYTRSEDYTWNRILQSYDAEYVTGKYRFQDNRGRYRLVVLTAPGTRTGDSGKPWRNYDPTKAGRHWAVPHRALEYLKAEGLQIPERLQDQLELLYQHGFVRIPAKKDGSSGVPEFKLYLGEGAPIQDVIIDIPPINSQAQERLGYPTQKPQALLERIIKASSNEGDTVLDPFCGCGTTVAAAQVLKRRWIGIDITHLAIGLIKSRLQDAYGAAATYRVIGEPTTVDGAAKLAEEAPYQFQAWALGLVGARRSAEVKKGADKGIDGRLYFHDGSDKTRQIILSVKAGKLQAGYVRDLAGVREQEHAEIGVLISFEKPTQQMRSWAAGHGFYESPWGKHPRLQLLTVGELLDGKRIDYPQTVGINRTYRQAPKAKKVAEPIRGLFDKDAPAD
jgi:DNA modification methylase